MATHETLTSLFSAIADKIRKKTGSTAAIVADVFPDAIDNILTPTDGSITTRTSANLTASGATVTVPAGYYETQATKSISTATQATPSISVSSSGLITASATQSAGYVSAGTKSATKQLTTQAAKTVTPSTSSQTAVASGRYTTGAVTVAAVPTQTKSATPKASSQTISPDSGKFLSSVTIAGDTNLKAENIKSGVSIFGVTGTMQKYSTITYGGLSIGSSNFNNQIISGKKLIWTIDNITLDGTSLSNVSNIIGVAGITFGNVNITGGYIAKFGHVGFLSHDYNGAGLPSGSFLISNSQRWQEIAYSQNTNVAFNKSNNQIIFTLTADGNFKWESETYYYDLYAIDFYVSI